MIIQKRPPTDFQSIGGRLLLLLFLVFLSYLYKYNQLFVSVFPTLLFFYRTINNYLLYFNN